MMGEQGRASDSLTQRARSILFTSREADFMQSFIRAGDDGGGAASSSGADRSISLALPLKLPQGATQDTPTSRRTLPTGEERRSSQSSVPAPPTAPPQLRKNTPFAQMTKDIKLRRIHQQQQELQMLLRQGRRSGKGDSYFRRGEECYTDKDRAAAVNMGNRDIKLSLKLKRRQERSKALQIPEQADPNTLLTLGGHEMKGGDLKVALGFVNKALELQPNDKHALIARSKCHLLLGLAEEALEDADAALAQDKHFVRAIFQKAEALYHLGDFEHSLMFYHRGQRLRPEQAGFRLGVQKAQEAIENAICSCRDKLALLSAKYADGFSLDNNNGAIASNSNEADDKEYSLKPATPLRLKSASVAGKSTPSSGKSRTSTSTASKQPKKKQHLLGQLSVDREYLENLLHHPDIKASNQDSVSHISMHAEEGVAFLKRRQEFWRQQCPKFTKK